MADITSIYGNPIKDAVARQNIATNTTDITQLKEDYTTILDSAYVTDTASGAIASFPDGADNVPVKSLKVNIEPVQSGSGDPSPDNVRPISGRTQAVVTRTGVNVWDEEWENGYWSRSTGQKVGTNSTYIRSKDYIPVLPGTSYYVKTPTSHASNYTYFAVLLYKADKTYISAIPNIATTPTFTTPSDCRYITFYSEGASSGQTYHNDISINIPSTDHDYHAYDGQTVTIDLGGTRYGGTLNVETGVLTVETEIKTLNGSEGFWSGTAVASGTRRFYTDTSYANKTVVACDSAKISTDTTVLNIICVSGNRLIMTPSWAQSAASIADFKTLLASNNVTIIQTLATPIIVQLTANEVQTLLGQNNIWSDAGTVDVEYRADTKLYIQKVMSS